VIADAPIAGLELYSNSITRADFWKWAGRKSLSQSFSPIIQVSFAWFLLFLKLSPWTATTLTTITCELDAKKRGVKKVVLDLRVSGREAILGAVKNDMKPRLSCHVL
jgi:hypothetical protein